MRRSRRLVPWLALAFVTAFHVVALRPELDLDLPGPNDQIFHYGLAQGALAAIRGEGSVLDPWFPDWTLGYPVFHHYQHLFHILCALVHLASGGLLSLLDIFRGVHLLSLLLLPLALYRCLIAFRLPRRPAAFAALLSLGLSSTFKYGIEIGSFTATGWGMWSQSLGALFACLALPAVRRTVRTGRGLAVAVLALALAFQGHMLFGFVAAVSSALLLAVEPRPLDRLAVRARRLLLVGGLTFLVLAYWLVPLLVDGAAHARSAYDPIEKFDSHGATPILSALVGGRLFDDGRLPVVTVLFFAGALVALGRPRGANRYFLAGFALWLLLFFGRETWGRLIDVLPLARDIHLHRFEGVVQLFALPFAGLGLDLLYRRARALPQRRGFGRALALGAVSLAVLPVFLDRAAELAGNADWIRSVNASRAAAPADGADLETAFADLRARMAERPGRVYPGLRANWGDRYRVDGYRVFYRASVARLDAVSYLPFSWSVAGDAMLNFDERRESHYRLFGVRYVLSPAGGFDPPGGKQVAAFGRHRVHETGDTGYLGVVEAPLAVRAAKGDEWNVNLIWLRSAWPDAGWHLRYLLPGEEEDGAPRRIEMLDRWRYRDEAGRERRLFFEGGERFLRGAGLAAPPGRVLAEEDGTGSHAGRVRAERECYVLLRSSWHPGWHATVDGEERRTARLSPGMPAVRVGPGEHAVRFEYRPRSSRTPLAVLSVLLLGFLFLRERRHAR